jgi:hypothetical protein
MPHQKGRTHADRRKDLHEKYGKRMEVAAPGDMSESQKMDELVRTSIRDHGA